MTKMKTQCTNNHACLINGADSGCPYFEECKRPDCLWSKCTVCNWYDGFCTNKDAWPENQER